jgi:outer membrane PBP1 activator LpoA protein
VLLGLLLAGCATTQGARPQGPAAAASAEFAQAAALARNNAALAGDARAENVRQIARLLAAVDDRTLAREAARLPAGDPLYDFVGKALQDRGLPLPRPFDSAAQWRFDLNGRPPADSDGYRPPVKLAVLLPLSGQLATAAAPVRDGLLAGYYGETRRRPEISFYDTAVDGGVASAYAQAVAAGADFVVGPLGRDEVDAVFAQASLPVPVLALNRGTRAPPAGNAGFSLAPEDDGQIAAEYLYGLEKRNALVIAGNDDNGIRAANAFRERFAQRGGNVADTLGVGENPGDLAAALANEARKNVDAVFLAVRGNTARLLAPQLALAGLGGKTRVGTSQLASGTGKADQDAALDGIVFPTEAWTSRGVAGLPAASAVAASTPTARGPAARLFAFGYDAWQLSAYLEKLVKAPNAEIRGATGTLKLDGFGNVLRTPAWSTFSGGQPVPVGDGG